MCIICQQREIAVGRRKFCASCGPDASRIWKQRQRRAWRKAGERYWRDNWKHASDAERRAYFRNYMKAYRLRQRESTQRHGLVLAPVKQGC